MRLPPRSTHFPYTTLFRSWHKKVGDAVKEGELLAEIETDKATMEFESFYDGVLLHIGVEKGKAAPINSVLAIIGKAGDRKSTRLNSSHSQISYAVFCLKKK